MGNETTSRIFSRRTMFVLLYVARVAAIPAQHPKRKRNFHYQIRRAEVDAALATAYLFKIFELLENDSCDLTKSNPG